MARVSFGGDQPTLDGVLQPQRELVARAQRPGRVPGEMAVERRRVAHGQANCLHVQVALFIPDS